MKRQTTRRTVDKAKTLRREMSLPEVMLWNLLRQKPEGLKFRRQHPVGPYVADFYCASAKTIIEVDGNARDMGDIPERDESRDTFLRSKGLRVVRVSASQVLEDPTATAEQIVQMCQGPSTIGVADGPPPHSLQERGGT